MPHKTHMGALTLSSLVEMILDMDLIILPNQRYVVQIPDLGPELANLSKNWAKSAETGVVATPVIYAMICQSLLSVRDAYLNHNLTGPQAAWAAKRYPGHRTYPKSILEELDSAGIH
ncbi:hypothetical protein FB451DRAFT_1199258 [Mycena latifolia]|nr:hypothetical protein FB451DRAFT_1199258 [Mycena latifolia]